MALVGPSRQAALDINIGAALVWLMASSVLVTRRWGPGTALCYLGLLLSAITLSLGPGGPYDFRLDFATTCLWGVLVAFIATTHSSGGWGTYVLATALGLALLATRLVAGFYLVPFGASIALISALAPSAYGAARARWRWSIVAGVWAIAMVIILASNLEGFADYYIRGHVTGGEAQVRRLTTGLASLRDDLLFYPRRVLADHLGGAFIVVAAIWFLVAIGIRILLRGNPAGNETSAPDSQQQSWWWLAVAGMAIAVPYAVLTVSAQKSSPVAGVFVGPITILIVGALALAARERARPSVSAALSALGVLTVSFALLSQWRQSGVNIRGLPDRGQLAGLTQVVADLAPWLTERSGQSPMLSMDAHHVEISSTTIQVSIYERTHSWIDLRGGRLGHGAIEQPFTRDEILDEARQSDVLILTDRPAPWVPAYPADTSVRDHHAVLLSYAREHMLLHQARTVGGITFWTFVRPRLSEPTTSASTGRIDWRSSPGLSSGAVLPAPILGDTAWSST
jgi:hypothetical protein